MRRTALLALLALLALPALACTADAPPDTASSGAWQESYSWRPWQDLTNMVVFVDDAPTAEAGVLRAAVAGALGKHIRELLRPEERHSLGIWETVDVTVDVLSPRLGIVKSARLVTADATPEDVEAFASEVYANVTGAVSSEAPRYASVAHAVEATLASIDAPTELVVAMTEDIALAPGRRIDVLVLPDAKGDECAADRERFPALAGASYAASTFPACDFPSQWAFADTFFGPDRFCLSARPTAQADGTPSCRVRVWLGPDQECAAFGLEVGRPEDLGQPAPSPGAHACLVPPLGGEAESRCRSEDSCRDCGTGFCVTDAGRQCGVASVRFTGGATTVPERVELLCDLAR